MKALIIASLLAALNAYAADAPVIESVAGSSSTVEVTHLTQVGQVGQRVDETEGYELAVGDAINVGPQQVVRILFADGSLVILSAGGLWRWDGELAGAPWSMLESGYAYVVVAHPAGAVAPVAHRFVFQTRAAVLGVRGTEFTVDQAGSAGEMQVHTLDGQVEVASDAKALRAGDVQPVARGQFARAARGSVRKPESFDRDAYLKDMANHHPGVGAILGSQPRARAAVRKSYLARQSAVQHRAKAAAAESTREARKAERAEKRKKKRRKAQGDPSS